VTRCLTVLALLAALATTTGAREQGGRTEPVPARVDYGPVTLHVACGELFKSPCARVLPRIAAQTTQAGLDLKPAASGGALATAAAVCQGQAAAAIVPRDAMAGIGHEPACFGRYDFVGRSLYPYYAFLVMKAGTSFRSLDDLANAGRQFVIAVGPEGSGGQITFGFLLRSNPLWQRVVAVTNDDAATALDRLADGSIDGLFTMETFDSELLDRVRTTGDGRGKPLYTFIDVRPGTEFSRTGDGGGHCLYRLTALDFGGPLPVATVSVDAVLMLGRTFHDAHARGGPPASEVLATAIDAARAGILADLKSPGDWRPVATSCQ
jgi:hypothetical protein